MLGIYTLYQLSEFVVVYVQVAYPTLPSGKRLHNELENHHALNGKIH